MWIAERIPAQRLRRERQPLPAVRTMSGHGAANLPGHHSRPRAVLGGLRLRPHDAVPHRGRGRDDEPGDAPPEPRAEPLEDGLSGACDPPPRRSLRREPDALPALPPVPGAVDADARRRARAVSVVAPG